MQRIVFLTGAGMSAESGINTFRDSDGLWEQYRVEDVCTPEGWMRDPALVTNFYNQRRRQTLEAQPNQGHQLIAALEQEPDFDVHVITQNVDDLHERAGSSRVLHLHGELNKVTSSHRPNDPRYIRTLEPGQWEVKMGDQAADGSQLRPFIVWFGESVPNLEQAADLSAAADLYVVIGTSLNVYPAAGLTDYVPQHAPIYLIDPKPVRWNSNHPFVHIQKGASEGMKELIKILKP
ncbi:MAG: NAD-dependent protein deacylase [Bacteroidaceae bacterium]|nr:NAD-dependent protein deacylase [Bacteroidaceae bacterium]